MTGETNPSEHGEPIPGDTGQTGEPRLRVAGGTGDSPPSDPQALAEDIERNRQELGETVEALAAKLDAPARAREKVAQARERITVAATDVAGRVSEKSEEARQQLAAGTARTARVAGERPVPVALAAAAMLAFAGWLTWMLRRR